jgi:hypothetical protein
LSLNADTVLDGEMRKTFKALADVLFPAEAAMPAASAADSDGAWLDRVLAVRPDLLPALTRVLAEAAGEDPRAEVRRLKRDDAQGFLALASACAGSYYLNPANRQLIGYPGQEPSLPEPGETDAELGGGILDPVVARGPVYRPAPAQ